MRLKLERPVIASSIVAFLFASVASSTAAAPGVWAPHPPSHGSSAQRHKRIRPLTCTGLGPGAFIGGGSGNAAAGTDAGVLAGLNNEACEDYSGVGTGSGNLTTGTGTYAFIGAGQTNTVANSWSFIGAGMSNFTAGQGGLSAIASGSSNGLYDAYSFIGAGFGNSVGTATSNSDEDGFIGAGSANSVTATNAAVVGGNQNTASGAGAFVPAGSGNIASAENTFAGGTASWANNMGSFVWSDDTAGATQLKSTAGNQFLVRASGGVKFYTNKTLTTGVTLAAGGGSWASVSDRSVKTNISSINEEDVLARIASMPIMKWSYISEEGSVRHIGPMAQDFFEAFHLGQDDRHITDIDEGGVSLAAIKALAEHARAADDEIRTLKGTIAQLSERLGVLESARR